jgi:hypothetical protein
MSSVASALSARTCRIRAETRGWGCPLPASVQVSELSSAAWPVVYKTAAHLTALEVILPLALRQSGGDGPPSAARRAEPGVHGFWARDGCSYSVTQRDLAKRVAIVTASGLSEAGHAA